MYQLNPRQLEAVMHIETPLLVLAGAGSGKTSVITQKIAHLIHKHELDPRNIYAVTFTNKAAKEMKQRIAKLLKDTPAKGLKISTFHTLGLNIIRQEYKALGYKPNFSIMDSTDTQQIIKELIKNNSLDTEELDGIQWVISNWKNQNISPEQALAEAEDAMEQSRAHLFAAYQKQLKAYNSVDFDDLILLPVKLFSEQRQILEKWQNRVRYLLVDEYQDTNAVQYQLVKQLVGLSGKLTVVGDDDQSIYAWRGAQPENLSMLQDDFPGLQLVKLEQNYRSSQIILEAANKLIANNPHVFDKKLWSDKGRGDPIKVLAASNETQEAERVVVELVMHKFRNRTQYSDYAILYRSNHQARLIERSLREQNIPYSLSGGQSFFDRVEVKDVLSYLKLLVNPADDAAFLRIINTPKREIGSATLEKLANYATSRETSLFNASQEIGLTQVLDGRAYDRVKFFSDTLLEWMKEVDYRAGEEVIPLIRDMLDELEYNSWLEEISSSAGQAERRINNVLDLILWMERIITKAFEEDGEELKLDKIVSYMTLMDILERNEDDAETQPNQVSLMTLHAAKGLEFPHVYLIGAEEKILPHKQNLESPGLEEERRLAYVGITRAQRSLTITYARKRRQYGEDLTTDPSRFLHELPEDIVDWEGKPGAKEMTQEEVKEYGLSQIEVLKAMLNNN